MRGSFCYRLLCGCCFGICIGVAVVALQHYDVLWMNSVGVAYTKMRLCPCCYRSNVRALEFAFRHYSFHKTIYLPRVTEWLHTGNSNLLRFNLNSIIL